VNRASAAVSTLSCAERRGCGNREANNYRSSMLGPALVLGGLNADGGVCGCDVGVACANEADWS
jgi:hypothetical protein